MNSNIKKEIEGLKKIKEFGTISPIKKPGPSTGQKEFVAAFFIATLNSKTVTQNILGSLPVPVPRTILPYVIPTIHSDIADLVSMFECYLDMENEEGNAGIGEENCVLITLVNPNNLKEGYNTEAGFIFSRQVFDEVVYADVISPDRIPGLMHTFREENYICRLPSQK